MLFNEAACISYWTGLKNEFEKTWKLMLLSRHLPEGAGTNHGHVSRYNRSPPVAIRSVTSEYAEKALPHETVRARPHCTALIRFLCNPVWIAICTSTFSKLCKDVYSGMYKSAQ
jgi:hypothetical protein